MSLGLFTKLLFARLIAIYSSWKICSMFLPTYISCDYCCVTLVSLFINLRYPRDFTSHTFRWGTLNILYIFQGIYIYVSHTHSLVYSSSREYLILRWMLWVRFLAFVPCFLLFLFSPALSPYVIFIVFLRLCSSSSHLLMYSQQVRIYVIVRVLSTCCVICILPHLGIPLCFIRAKRVSNWYIPKKKSARVPVCPCARVK